ncbi:hypothetical protein HK104_009402 [Borealophlyctis nickersoniae]|nr:hypothetical protein HK104_009402 [Borealophlyctis nickersoniae]
MSDTPKQDRSTGDPSPEPTPEWAEAHRKALENGEQTYTDPATGYSVFTEISHRERGMFQFHFNFLASVFVGLNDRHCPYNYDNVGKPEKIKAEAKAARVAKKSSSLPGYRLLEVTTERFGTWTVSAAQLEVVDKILDLNEDVPARRENRLVWYLDEPSGGKPSNPPVQVLNKWDGKKEVPDDSEIL